MKSKQVKKDGFGIVAFAEFHTVMRTVSYAPTAPQLQNTTLKYESHEDLLNFSSPKSKTRLMTFESLEVAYLESTCSMLTWSLMICDSICRKYLNIVSD